MGVDGAWFRCAEFVVRGAVTVAAARADAGTEDEGTVVAGATICEEGTFRTARAGTPRWPECDSRVSDWVTLRGPAPMAVAAIGAGAGALPEVLTGSLTSLASFASLAPAWP